MYWTPHILTTEVTSGLQVQRAYTLPNESHFPVDSTDFPLLNTIPHNDSTKSIQATVEISEDPPLDSGMLKPTWHNGTQQDSFHTRNATSSQGVWEDLVASELPLLKQLRLPLFWVIFLFLVLFYVGLSSSIIFGDTACYMILGKAERSRFGQQRLWGTVGWGLSALVTGALVDLYSAHLQTRDYFPAFVLMIVFMSLAIVVTACMRLPERKEETLKAGEVRGVISSPGTILFLVTCVVLGMTLGFLWAFHLILVEEVALAWDPNFPGLKFLQGLMVAIQCFLGEVPFWFLAGRIIEYLGTSRVLILVMTVNGVRFISYYFISNPWIFLPIEILNGISYGLFYATVTAHASEIAPPGAQATLQGIIRATQFTGKSLAGIGGGALWSRVGGQCTFLIVGLVNVLYCVFYALCQFLIRHCCRQKAEKGLGNSGYMRPGENKAPRLQ
ncbi:major facilitator superfamily domain-containing protein 6-like isoform X2 [Oratosquilla oratoria]